MSLEFGDARDSMRIRYTVSPYARLSLNNVYTPDLFTIRHIGGIRIESGVWAQSVAYERLVHTHRVYCMDSKSGVCA